MYTDPPVQSGNMFFLKTLKHMMLLESWKIKAHAQSIDLVDLAKHGWKHHALTLPIEMACMLWNIELVISLFSTMWLFIPFMGIMIGEGQKLTGRVEMIPLWPRGYRFILWMFWSETVLANSAFVVLLFPLINSLLHDCAVQFCKHYYDNAIHS